MCDIWNDKNRWLLERFQELVRADPHRFHDIYKKMPKTGMVYLFSFGERDWVYVGVAVQKGGRMSSHRHNLKKGIATKLRPYLEAKLRKKLDDEEITYRIGELQVRWIVEPDKGKQERIEALTAAILMTPLNCQGRKGYGKAKRRI
jgi:hypothetical protein